jgi:hypothetical protein
LLLVVAIRQGVPTRYDRHRDHTLVDGERLVQETMRFLLEREPATSILPEFSLDDVPRFFPEFHEQLRRRLSA